MEVSAVLVVVTGQYQIRAPVTHGSQKRSDRVSGMHLLQHYQVNSVKIVR